MNNSSAEFPPEYRAEGVTMNLALEQHPESSQDRDYGIKLVAYGGRSAIQCQQSVTSAGWHTIQFEAAAKTSNVAADRTYCWAHKITFQITDSELPYLVAVLFGFIPEIRFDLHGSEKNKWLEIIKQGTNFFFRVGMSRTTHAVPVSLAETSMFGLLALNQYTANYPLLNSDSVLTSVRMLVSQTTNVSGAYKLPQKNMTAR